MKELTEHEKQVRDNLHRLFTVEVVEDGFGFILRPKTKNDDGNVTDEQGKAVQAYFDTFQVRVTIKNGKLLFGTCPMTWEAIDIDEMLEKYPHKELKF